MKPADADTSILGDGALNSGIENADEEALSPAESRWGRGGGYGGRGWHGGKPDYELF